MEVHDIVRETGIKTISKKKKCKKKKRKKMAVRGGLINSCGKKRSKKTKEKRKDIPI